MSLEASLAKLRPHTSSSLAHQKAPANLLIALESTFADQGTEQTPTAYFAALLTTLQSSQSNVSFGDGDLLPAILYLLALVAPHVPHPVIRSHLSTLLSLLAPLFSALVPHAPPLRSLLSLLGAIIQALEPSQLDSTTIRQSFTFILDLTVDRRPKVRKKAVEVVRDVLGTPPPPLLRHPYSERVGEWANIALSKVGSSVGKSGKKAVGNDAPEVGIHLIAMLKPIISDLPKSHFTALTSTLLSLPRLGNPYLSQSSYTLLTTLISDTSDMATLVSSLFASPPARSDIAQTPAWLDLLGAAFSSNGSAFHTDKEVEAGFRTVFAYLEAAQLPIRMSAARALTGILTNFVPASLVEEAIAEHGQMKPKSPLSKIIAHIRTSLDALPYARAMPQMLSVLGALLPALRHRTMPSAPTAAEILLLDLVQKIGEMRVKKGFEHKDAVDEVLRVSMSVLGPEVMFRVLPLGLIPEDREQGREPHAYLLPLLKVSHPTPLRHFARYFVPLSERMFDLQQSAETRGRVHEAKMWDVLIAQVWAGLVGYCWGTGDLVESFNPEFAQLLSQILYNQPALRPEVLKALKTIVESNAALASGTRPAWASTDTITSADAVRNIAHLRAQAESWFAVLFNVFGSVSREARGAVGEVIAAWVQIAGDEEIAKVYKRIVELLETTLSSSGSPEAALMAQELLVLILPMLPAPECLSLWTVCTCDAVLASTDPGVQKRGYRILARLVQGGKLSGVLDGEVVIQQLEQRADAVLAPAKRERTTLLALLLPLLPSTSLHLIPSLIPEAVLTTKEPAERTRSAAFDLIVAMGRKMQEGGIVVLNRVNGMEEDGTTATEVQASVEEYLTMVAAGLAGATPHMISASITAISRLLFEFKDTISPNMLDELIGTLLVFVGSANREIVKSTLGFIKLSVHALPPQLVSPHLQQLVPALLGWAGDHKNHFKIKVRHIFERMIRRFGWDAVYACVGSETEAKVRSKVLLNIKKRKDRAKRKKAQRAEEEEDEEDAPATHKTGDAFEDVLYGSESDIEDSDEDVGGQLSASNAGGRGHRDKGGARLRIDDDEPMDLLHGAADNLTGAARARRKPGHDASHFKTDEETGRMVIDGDDHSDDADATDPFAGAAYGERLTSADGFTRGSRGRVKFNKDTKKRRRANEDEDGDGEDVEMADEGVSTVPNKNKKQKKGTRLGQEFKAKNAGGDVKKGGMDPYAYLPLSQASKKSGKGNNISVVGRR